MNVTILFPSINKVAPTKVIFEIILSMLNSKPSVNFKIISLSKVNHNNYYKDFKSLGIPVYFLRDMSWKTFIKIMKNSHIIHANGLRPNILLFILKSFILPKQVICTTTCHSVENEDFVLSRGNIKGGLGYRVNQFCFKRMDAVFCVSAKVKKYIDTNINCNSVLAQNGIFFGKMKKTSLQDKITLIQVGRFSQIKNQKFTVEIIDILEKKQIDYKLYFAGDYNNNYGEEIFNELKENKNVEFLGHIDENKLEYYLSVSDILMMPSLTEGFPLSPLEGFSQGVYFIGSDIESLHAITHTETLGCVLELNPNLWVNKILQAKETLDIESKKNIRDIAESFFSSNITADQYYKEWTSKNNDSIDN